MTYALLNKAEKDCWLPQLFDLFYRNMNTIAPSGMSYEEERAEWLSAVSPALDKAPRQILLCCEDGKLAGYIQYYTRGDLLMIEELQLAAIYQRSTVFFSLVRALVRLLPEGIRYVEAFADSRNRRSIALMKKLGMEILEETEFVHLRGDAGAIWSFFYHA